MEMELSDILCSLENVTHVLLQGPCMCASVPSLSCPALCSPPGPSVHRTSQARTLARVALHSSSRGSSRHRDGTWISWIGRRVLDHWVSRETCTCTYSLLTQSGGSVPAPSPDCLLPDSHSRLQVPMAEVMTWHKQGPCEHVSGNPEQQEHLKWRGLGLNACPGSCGSVFSTEKLD